MPSNNATATLAVNILDVNDNAPVFIGGRQTVFVVTASLYHLGITISYSQWQLNGFHL